MVYAAKTPSTECYLKPYLNQPVLSSADLFPWTIIMQHYVGSGFSKGSDLIADNSVMFTNCIYFSEKVKRQGLLNSKTALMQC